MRSKIGALCCALLIALIAAFGVNSPTAQASHDGDSIPDEFEVSGWWNNPSGTNDTPERQWTYANYPITCNNSAQPAIQVLWVTKPGQTVVLDDPVKLGKVRDDFNRVSSIFAASAKKVLSDYTSQLNSKTPRFVTWQSGSGRCYPVFERVQVDAAVYDAGASSIWNALRTGNNSNAKTYNAANRKYLSITQSVPPNDPLGAYGGVAEMPGYMDGADKTPENSANNGSHLLAVSNEETRTFTFARATAHEIAHSLGAVAYLAPHRNQTNGGHPADCLEVVCYKPLGDIPGQYNACGLDNYTNPEAYRLDCNKDDYFNNSPGSGNYLYTHFNLSTDSTYLWGAATLRYPPGVAYPGGPMEDPHL